MADERGAPPFKPHHWYYVAATLFFIAAALSILNHGITWRVFAGLVIGAGLIVLGRNMRKAGG